MVVVFPPHSPEIPSPSPTMPHSPTPPGPVLSRTEAPIRADTFGVDDGVDDADTVTDLHYQTIAAAIDLLVTRYPETPSLDELAEAVSLSPFHFQRLFRRWAGISPKRFAQFLALDHARHLLAAHTNLLDTALEVGLSGPSRLHDLFMACEAMSPGAYKARGRDLVIRWGIHNSPFGRALLGATERGLCWLSFVVADDDSAIRVFADEWSLAQQIHDPVATAPLARRAFFPAAANTTAHSDQPPAPPLPLLLRGTNFQIKVWEALMRIPPGHRVCYEDIARAIGQPTAMRAVGHAVGRNPISWLIPCHRVILKSGAIRNYRWHPQRKKILLAWESAQATGEAALE